MIFSCWSRPMKLTIRENFPWICCHSYNVNTYLYSLFIFKHKYLFQIKFCLSFNFSQRCKETPIYSMPSNIKKIGGQYKKSDSERLLQIYSSFWKSYLFEWKRKPLGCETLSSDWPLFVKFCPNWLNFFPSKKSPNSYIKCLILFQI